ncbi:A24 family peptidase [Ramlibacter sp. MAHUQ-53]|uniref:A24 family peptidase n=1 Tax=unclassified Ramlibacter TaxID=2617605 RepID=UPI003628458B
MSLLPDFVSTTLWPLASSPGWGGLIALLALAAVIDLRSGRIPNWLTVTGMGWGLAFSASQGLGTGAGLATGLAGLATGLAVMLPLYLLRATGAGDVKLMAMTGAFLGTQPMLVTTLFVFIAGGVMALLHLALRAAARQAAARPQAGPATPAPASLGRIRYGASIFAGTLAFLVLRQLAQR